MEYIKVEYTVYEPELKQHFSLVKHVASMADFSLYAKALYAGRYIITNIHGLGKEQPELLTENLQ